MNLRGNVYILEIEIVKVMDREDAQRKISE